MTLLFLLKIFTLFMVSVVLSFKFFSCVSYYCVTLWSSKWSFKTKIKIKQTNILPQYMRPVWGSYTRFSLMVFQLMDEQLQRTLCDWFNNLCIYHFTLEYTASILLLLIFVKFKKFIFLFNLRQKSRYIIRIIKLILGKIMQIILIKEIINLFKQEDVKEYLIIFKIIIRFLLLLFIMNKLQGVNSLFLQFLPVFNFFIFFGLTCITEDFGLNTQLFNFIFKSAWYKKHFLWSTSKEAIFISRKLLLLKWELLFLCLRLIYIFISLSLIIAVILSQYYFGAAYWVNLLTK